MRSKAGTSIVWLDLLLALNILSDLANALCAMYLKAGKCYNAVELFVALFMLGCVSLTHCGGHNISHNGMLATLFRVDHVDDEDGAGL